MSVPRDFDTQPIPRVSGGGERRRAAIALLVLAVIAVAIVAIMVNVLGGSNRAPTSQHAFHFAGPPVTHMNKTSQPPPTSAPPTSVPPGSSQPSSATPSSSMPTTEPRTSKPPSKPTKSKPRKPHSPRGPSNRRVSCPTSGACPLRDDIGDALGALNTYRAKHGLPPVTGAVTPAAATCAATAAGQCPNGYHWEPVGRSGHQVIEKIAARGGDAFLLSPRLRHVQIGWAYVPTAHSFYCALVAPGT